MKLPAPGRLRRMSLVVAAVAAALLATSTTQAVATPTITPAASTAGCGSAPTLASGTHTITSSGKSRSYILDVPTNYDRSHPYRLVFGLHWLGGSAEDVATGRTVLAGVWSYYGLKQLSDNSTIFVAPQGLNNGWANPGGQDVTLIDDILRQVEGGLCVDTTRVFSVGFSYGAAMTYALACARPTVFRAVALYSGGLLSGCSGGTQPVAYLASHGVSDPVLSISGGRALRDRFVKNNQCTPQTPKEPAKGSRTHIATTYAGCSAGHPVEWVAFDGGHDASPADGANATAPAPVKGRTTWLPAETWKFFTQF